MVLSPQDYQVNSLVGKQVYVLTRQGQIVDGILQKVDHGTIYLRATQSKKKKVGTSAFFGFNPIAPLVLFDLLAIGTSPFAFGGFPFFI
jgi:hypothetical protein